MIDKIHSFSVKEKARPNSWRGARSKHCSLRGQESSWANYWKSLDTAGHAQVIILIVMVNGFGDAIYGWCIRLKRYGSQQYCTRAMNNWSLYETSLSVSVTPSGQSGLNGFSKPRPGPAWVTGSFLPSRKLIRDFAISHPESNPSNLVGP